MDSEIKQKIKRLTVSVPRDCQTVALWVQRLTRDPKVAGSTRARALLSNNLREVVHTLVPLSPSSTSWYQKGNNRLWKRCGLLSIN